MMTNNQKQRARNGSLLFWYIPEWKFYNSLIILEKEGKVRYDKVVVIIWKY